MSTVQAEHDFARRLGIRERKPPEPDADQVLAQRLAESSTVLAQACEAALGAIGRQRDLDERDGEVKRLGEQVEQLRGEIVATGDRHLRELADQIRERDDLAGKVAELQSEKVETNQDSDDNAEQERLRGELSRSQKELLRIQRRAEQAEKKVLALAGRKRVVAPAKREPSDISSEIRRDPAGLLTGMVLRASGYDDLKVIVRRGPNDEVVGLNFT